MRYGSLAIAHRRRVRAPDRGNDPRRADGPVGGTTGLGGEATGRRIVAERGPMSPERLRWEVALEHYGDHPVMRLLIERKLANVSS